jgi:hypothetical protein
MANNTDTPSFADPPLHELPSPRDFFDTFIQKRRPVLLKGCAASVIPKLTEMATLDQLLELVGPNATVQVNKRHCKSSFSPKHSHVVTMEFSDFIQQLKSGSGSDKYYMTTQSLGVDHEGRPQLYTTPVTQLVEAGIITNLRPLGNLVPMTYNLWMGTSCASSGLHHDYHDNLYCLLEGTKSFRIAPPQSVKTLKVKGTLHTLHPNGRIVYQEQVDEGGMIRPDGALVKVERIMQLEIRKREIEEELIHKKKQDELEEELDAIEEELLDLEMDGECDDDDDKMLFGGKGVAIDETDSDDSTLNPPIAKKVRVDPEDTVPLNFVLEEDPRVHFQTIEMCKGDLLFLPAGWYHEVLSRGDLHIAFNYWMHPPDTGTCFEKPYLSQFWQRDWESRSMS